MLPFYSALKKLSPLCVFALFSLSVTFKKVIAVIPKDFNLNISIIIWLNLQFKENGGQT